MNVWSPTETADYIRCPMYRRLTRAWKPRDQVWTPNKALGIAIGEGLSAYWRGQPTFESESTVSLIMAREYEENEKWSLEALLHLALKGYRAACAKAEITGVVLGVDQPIGRGRPDLVYRHSTLGLTVLDGKVRMEGDTRYLPKYLSEYETDHQWWHYAWETEQYYGEPVHQCEVLLTILTPRVRVERHAWPVSPARVGMWLQDTEHVWEQMDREAAGQPPTHRFSSCFTKYGRCAYFTFCHDCEGDEQRARALYEQGVPR